MFSGVCSRLDHQNWSTILLSCTSSSPLLFSFIISSPFKAPWCPKYLLSNLSQISPRQHFQVGEEGTGLQNLLVFLFIQLWPKKDVVLYGAVLDPGLLRDIGHSALGWEGSDHMTVLFLWKCSVEGGGGRSWEEQMECRFLKNVRLTEQLIFIKVHVFIAPSREKDSISYASFEVSFFGLSLSSHDPKNGGWLHVLLLEQAFSQTPKSLLGPTEGQHWWGSGVDNILGSKN